MDKPIKERITRREIDAYKREILDQCVMVTTEDAAAMLAVAPRTIARYVEQGRLTAYNNNSSSKGVRILAADLLEYVRSIRVDPLGRDK